MSRAPDGLNERARDGPLHDDRTAGQATVELAIVLPFLIVFGLAVAQVGLVVRAQIMVLHGAREAARALAVDPEGDGSSAVQAATTLDPARTTVSVAGDLRPGGNVTVTVDYQLDASLPLVGIAFDELDISGEATMLVEGEPPKTE